ncbi:MAG TPA: FecR family protein [Thermoanaerobaculia bacterium]|jgi:hypothetical protein
MKRAVLLTLLVTLAAIPMQAVERHQSFFSYDDGGTVVRQGDDGREIEARVNLPVYPGDAVVTSRRGRAELHLSDGNTIGIDRATAVKLHSILDSYEGNADQTVAELSYGKVAIYRTELGRDYVRLDTKHASYVAAHEAVYSVESDGEGRDRVNVFDGAVEIRTPNRTTRLRAGETATVDDRGVYDLVNDALDAADDFERWFLRRAERFDRSNDRYIADRRLSYWADDLDTHGRWVSVGGMGYAWRPYVAAGWRPYFHGYWSHRYGGLTWVSYDPWGWVPYHYGRWAFDPGFGWVWFPGRGYSPAWVYWMYGDSYVGWAPAGYWDCYRPYYNWAYNPYRNTHHFGFGFHGNVRVSELDMRPWVFMDSNTIATLRADRAALTADAVKNRLSRGERGGIAAISGSPARFTREEVRDPAAAIRRRGLDGQHLGRESGQGATQGGALTDMTGFFRRDPDVSTPVRDRITRGRSGGGSTTTPVAGGIPSRAPGTGSVAPIGGGSLAPIGRGNVAPVDGSGGSLAPIGRGNDAPPATSPIGGTTRGPRVITIPDRGRDRDDSALNGNTGGGNTGGSTNTWRDRVRGGDAPAAAPAPSAPAAGTGSSRDDASWRRRPATGDAPAADSGSRGSSAGSSTSGSDVPRRVIDRIGGARVVPRDSESGSSSAGSGRGSRGDSGSARREGSGSRDSGSSRREGSGSRDSGGSVNRGGGDSGSRPSAPPPPPPSANSGNGSSGNRSEGGSIRRNRD